MDKESKLADKLQNISQKQSEVKKQHQSDLEKVQKEHEAKVKEAESK